MWRVDASGDVDVVAHEPFDVEESDAGHLGDLVCCALSPEEDIGPSLQYINKL